MDSLTQIALGAAVGEATLGKKVGNRAMVWGMICGTLPDLDVFVPMGDAVKDFVYHRSASHSLFVLAVISPIMVWIISLLHTDTRQYNRDWFWLVYFVFATHVLLDSFTVYGTQIFWPIWTTPMTWSSIFIIDPLYTVPLLLGVVLAMRMSRATPTGHNWNTVGLVLSSVYLAWSLGAKLYVEDIAKTALTRDELPYSNLITIATPFNTVLWRILAVNDSNYMVGYYSLLDRDKDIRFDSYPRNDDLLNGIEDTQPVQLLRWFTKGFYGVTKMDRDVVINDLRMGLEPEFVFRFRVGELSNPHTRLAPVERINSELDWSRLRLLPERILSNTSGPPSPQLKPNHPGNATLN